MVEIRKKKYSLNSSELMLNKKSIILFWCNNDGHSNPIRRDPRFFIILSGRKYNDGSKTFLAIPTTTSKENFYSSSYGYQLDPDDFEGYCRDFYGSFVMCDRPCRIKSDDVCRDDEGNIKPRKPLILKHDTIVKIVEKIGDFILNSP